MTADPSAPLSDPISDFFLDNPQKLDDPFADLAWLRERRPVYWHEPVSQWFVFPSDEIQSLFSDKRLSANRMAGFVDAAPESARDELRTLVPYLEKWLLFRDGPEHAQLRTVLHRGFNTKAIEALREPIGRAANQLLDRAIDSGRLDVAADFGFLLPAYVLSDFMGVRPADRDRVAVVGRLRGLLQHHPDHRGDDPPDGQERHRDDRLYPRAPRRTAGGPAR